MELKGRAAPASILILIGVAIACFSLMYFYGNVEETIICRNEAYRVEEHKTDQGLFLIAYKTSTNEVVKNRELLAEIYTTRLAIAIARIIHDASNVEEIVFKVEKASKILRSFGFKIPSKLRKIMRTKLTTILYLLKEYAKVLVEKRSDEQAKIFLGKLAITALTTYLGSGYYSREAAILTAITMLSLTNIEDNATWEEIYAQIYSILEKNIETPYTRFEKTIGETLFNVLTNTYGTKEAEQTLLLLASKK
ncbi:MAG: hypothetical protein B6U76_00800 [Desulfurococcales archaeon ex4484_217_2]|nr:MAG: hypothetical protein B6U76_00800 [Desulfurococcales archaeon ex4484_217_2]